MAFIAIHGTPGENGKLQGYFEMIGQPYTGCDRFSSALTFNKYFCNLAVASIGVPISPSLHFYHNDPVDYDRIERVCGYPCFVKACNSGSSVGVTKVHGREELEAAFAEAREVKGMPVAIIMKTVKGKGVSFMENQAGWHGKAPNDEQFAQARSELEAQIRELEG